MVQVYVTERCASVSRPVRELKAFEKCELEAGESKTLEFAIPVNALGYYNTSCTYEVNPGEFEVMVSDCSDPDMATNLKGFKFKVRATQSLPSQDRTSSESAKAK